jgi:hypothetical protein
VISVFDSTGLQRLAFLESLPKLGSMNETQALTLAESSDARPV